MTRTPDAADTITIENAKNNSPPRGTRRTGGSNLSKTRFFLRVPRVLRGGELNFAMRSLASHAIESRLVRAETGRKTRCFLGGLPRERRDQLGVGGGEFERREILSSHPSHLPTDLRTRIADEAALEEMQAD